MQDNRTPENRLPENRLPELRKTDSPAILTRTLPGSGGASAEPEALATLVNHYLWVIWGEKWLILLFVMLCSAAALLISRNITPIYEATATVEIDRRSPTGVVGQEATQVAQGDAEQYIATQVRLIQSASVLGPVAQQFKLGGDSNLPTNNSSTPQVKGAVSLPGLKVVHVPGTYIILISYRSTSPTTAADVANAVAHSFIDRTFQNRISSTAGLSQFMVKQIDELRAKMERSSAAVVEFSKDLTYVNPEEKTNVLSNRLIQLNAEYTASQTDRVRKEAAFQEIKNGTLEAAQTSGQGENTRKLAEKLEEAQQKFEQVKALYGPKHPEYQRAATEVALLRQALGNTTSNTLKRVQSEYNEALAREDMLRKAVGDLKNEVDSMNARSTQYQSRIREADADRKLYEELVQKIKEASINAGFDNNSIRLADPAQPVFGAVSPNIRNNVILAFLLSLFVAVAFAILRDATNSTVRDPESISRLLRTEVIGTIPLVKDWKGRRHILAENERIQLPDGNFVPFLESVDRHKPIDGFDEAMRSLRNTILLSTPDRQIKKILFTSASPAEGKTTTAVHIAVAHALQGYKTLLIDADLRRPGTRKILNYAGKGGLSEVIRADAQWRKEITNIESVPYLDILPAGQPVLHSASMLEKIMPQILHEADEDYNLIVIDAPPMLGFSEPLHLAHLVEGVVIIARVNQTDRKAVAAIMHALRQLHVRVLGIVLNGVTKELSDRYSYHAGYEKYQHYYYSDKTS
jgi:capsular exopolysaccharide synthesis family protein